MKLKDVAKQERQLREAESELRERLLEVLPRVVTSGEPLFVHPGKMPDHWKAHWLCAESEQLHALALRCVELRSYLLISKDSSLAMAFLAACDAAGDAGNAHRLGPRRQAEAILELANAKPS